MSSTLDYSEVESLISKFAFVPTGPTQELSVGFVPPRGIEHGALVESIDGHLIMRVAIETRSVPGRAIREKVDAKATEIENSTGRKPGKKERRELQDEVLLTLLPTAFPKRTDVNIWIDNGARLLMLDSSSQGKSDEVVSTLIKAIPHLSLSLVHTFKSPQQSMTEWLLAPSADDWPSELCVERECTLKGTGEDAASVKFKNHHLATDDVRKHVAEGKLPTELALSWDGRAAFVLTEHLRLKKVRFLDGVMDKTGVDKQEDRFDADVAIATGLLKPVIKALIDALGGTAEISKEAGAQ